MFFILHSHISCHSISFSLSNADSGSLQVPAWPQSDSTPLFLPSSCSTLSQLLLTSVQMTHRISILKLPFILSLFKLLRGHLTYAHCSWASYPGSRPSMRHRRRERALVQSMIPTAFPQLPPSLQQLTGGSQSFSHIWMACSNFS